MSSATWWLGTRTAALTFTSAPGKNYQILIGLNLEGPLQPYMTIPSSGEGTTTIDLPATAITQFFGVEVVP